MPKYLNVDWVLSGFAKRRSLAIERYKRFVSEGKVQPSPWASLRNQVYLGSEQFVEKMQSLIERDKELSEVPTSQRRAKPKALEYYETANPDRNTAISPAYRSGDYTLKQIGDYFGLHYSTVSGIVRDYKPKT